MLIIYEIKNHSLVVSVRGIVLLYDFNRTLGPLDELFWLWIFEKLLAKNSRYVFASFQNTLVKNTYR